MLVDKLCKTIEVYIDGMVVNTVKNRNHLDDLKNQFTRLTEYKIRIDPSKCTFKVHNGRFLGYMTTYMGIETSTEQVKANTYIPSPITKKEIQ